MNAELVEAFLAKIYVDESSRQRFLADPKGEALRFGLSGAEAGQLEMIDREGLEMAAESYARKRQKRCDRESGAPASSRAGAPRFFPI
jgi:hypothetical protein